MITAAFVRECKPRAMKYEVICDALPGFILRVLPTGKKVALIRYQIDGKDHRVKIGLLGPALSIDEARRRAAVMLADVTADASDDEPPVPQAAGGPGGQLRRARVNRSRPGEEPSSPSTIFGPRAYPSRHVPSRGPIAASGYDHVVHPASATCDHANGPTRPTHVHSRRLRLSVRRQRGRASWRR
ncbi:Arm DNA-binding domain-containing protein [Nannocystis bainbridge]|uniref:Arm DNA-binding domain-containing protein n=1 Tax=Nannocystis bainbridge TaxID=2995303 RepID=A0ABT5E3B5_9BACT|nr:Arm DNA-binding domain-containing protein [Nannocystis bainbridge]MDC0720357.1 Arm DNA-binding domain-containing protein [Nannocystis bainbridge]